MPRRKTVAIATLAVVSALLFAAPVAATTPAAAVLRTGLPNHTLTPGAWNPAVTQATIHSTICVAGWTTTIRPATSFTNALKVAQIKTYGFADKRVGDYEEDHLISLELGGAARSSRNLWPEPHHIKVGGVDLGSFTKDAFETHLKSLVCSGRLTLAKARAEIAGNWVAYWKAWKGY
jgi:hypothetical protein